MDVALNAEFNVKVARYNTHGYSQTSFDRAEPIELSHAYDRKAEIQLWNSNVTSVYVTCAVA